MSDARDPQEPVRASIFLAVLSERDEEDYRWVRQWLARWGDRVRVVAEGHSAPDCYWDVEGPAEAVAEIPERLSCLSDWSSKPYPPVRERKAKRHGRR